MQHTARPISAAAAITVAVFGSLVLSDVPALQEMGFALASRSRCTPPNLAECDERSVSEGIGERSAVGIDGGGWPEFDTPTSDGDVPALEVDLLVMHRTQQAAISDGRDAVVGPVHDVVRLA